MSESGTVVGPWRHVETPLFGGQGEDGGHAMILRDFSGDLLLVFHQPNGRSDSGTYSNRERAQIYRIREDGNKLVLNGRWTARVDDR